MDLRPNPPGDKMNRAQLLYGFSKGWLLAMAIVTYVDASKTSNQIGGWIAVILLLIYGVMTEWINSLPEKEKK